MRLNRILRCIREPVVFKHNRNCLKCIHFEFQTGNCVKIKQQDFITGELKNISAEMCRKDETKCGFQAVYYNELTEKEEEMREREIKYYNRLGNIVLFIIIPIGVNMCILSIITCIGW